MRFLRKPVQSLGNRAVNRLGHGFTSQTGQESNLTVGGFILNV
jgi:hypothetical protein